MKIRASVHKICEKCRQISRQGRIIVIFSNPRAIPIRAQYGNKESFFGMKWIYPYISDSYL